MCEDGISKGVSMTEVLRRRGEINVTTGTMSSGKTEELIRRLRRGVIARQKVQAFYPDMSERRHPGTINSANWASFPAEPFDATDPAVLLEMIDEDTTMVGVDEIQFLPVEYVKVCMELRAMGVTVHNSSLDMNFRGEPFGETPGRLMSVAFDVQKLHAVCVQCGEDATVPQRLVKNHNGRWVPAPASSGVVAVAGVTTEGNGGSSGVIYEARCWECHQLPDEIDEN